MFKEKAIESRWADWLALLFVVALILIFVVFTDPFIEATKSAPLPMGFLKVAVLATFGTMLKVRRKSKAWVITPAQLLLQTIVWGLYGVWFALAFPGFSHFVQELIGSNLWPAGGKVWVAFSKSLWINILGGYAFPMMLVHEYLDKLIEHLVHQRRFLHPRAFGNTYFDSNTWFWFIPKTILLFWLPMHTVTFLLPSHFQVLFAAALSVALGFILTLRK